MDDPLVLLSPKWRAEGGRPIFSPRGDVAAVGIGVVFILLALPLDKETHKELFQLLALLITAVITLFPTTFVSNALAGFMLRGM